MHMTDFAYDGPIFLVPLSLSYPSSPVIILRLDAVNKHSRRVLCACEKGTSSIYSELSSERLQAFRYTRNSVSVMSPRNPFRDPESFEDATCVDRFLFFM